LFVCFALAGSPWTKRSELSNLRPQGSQLDQTELEANSGSLRKSTQNNDQVSHQSMNPIQKLFLASSLKSEQVSLSLSRNSQTGIINTNLGQRQRWPMLLQGPSSTPLANQITR